jgi:hypothetical protein
VAIFTVTNRDHVTLHRHCDWNRTTARNAAARYRRATTIRHSDAMVVAAPRCR